MLRVPSMLDLQSSGDIINTLMNYYQLKAVSHDAY